MQVLIHAWHYRKSMEDLRIHGLVLYNNYDKYVLPVESYLELCSYISD